MNLDCLAKVCYQPLGDKGEDAHAFAMDRSDIHAMAVFDGCGGAGAWKYPEFLNSSGAFVAAQTCSSVFQEWAESLSDAMLEDPAKLASGYSQSVFYALSGLKQACEPMGVSGSLVKSFPCTASVALVSDNSPGKLTVTALNAGDSRVYVLSPFSGLGQLTKDDSRGDPDPLESIRENAPLSNMMNGDRPFPVRCFQAIFRTPCAVLCATDGVFSFVRSPMDFECLLLRSLLEADSVAGFEEAFASELKRISADDCTCLLAFYGWRSFSGIRESFRERFDELKGLLSSVDLAGSHADEEILLHKVWEQYRKKALLYESQEMKNGTHRILYPTDSIHERECGDRGMVQGGKRRRALLRQEISQPGISFAGSGSAGDEVPETRCGISRGGE